MNIKKNAIEKWGRLSRLLKWGIFTGCAWKIWITFMQKEVFGYLKDTKFYLESKASFIHISSIASFKPFFIAWLWEYCTFSDSSVVSLKSSPWPKYTQYGTIFPQKSTIEHFFFFKCVLYLKYLKKGRGSPCSVKRKGAFISLSNLVWGKCLTFCTCTRSCARAKDAKIVRSRDAQCNTKELS